MRGFILAAAMALAPVSAVLVAGRTTRAPLAPGAALASAPPSVWDLPVRGDVPSSIALQPVSNTVRADATRGLELFAEHCAACHGPTGDGDGRLADRLPSPPPPFRGRDAATQSTLRQTYDTITAGRLDRMMPPFADSLTDDERWSLAAAVQTLRTGPEQLIRGQTAFDQSCAECHLSSAESGLVLRTADNKWSEAARRHAADWSAESLLQDSLAEANHPAVALPQSDSQLRAAIDYLLSAAFDPLSTDGLTTDGQVVGRVVLAPELLPVAGVDVAATSYALGLPGSVVTATTDTDGRFVLTDRLAGSGVNMLLAAEHDGVSYTQVVTPTATGAPGESVAEIVVYSTTTTAPLVAERAHILLSPAPEAGVIRAVEIWTIENASQTTLVADQDGATLRFLLPPEAVGARFGPGSAHADSQSGSMAVGQDAFELATANPVLPGTSEVSFEYEVPYNGESLDWPVRTALPADEVNMAIVAEGVTMTSGGSESRTGDVGGQPVTGLSLGAMGVGEARQVSIGGLAPPDTAPAALARRAQRPWSAILATAAAVIGVLVAATFPLWGADRADLLRERDLKARRSALVDRIAKLDQDRAAGRLGEAEHRAMRAALMAEAVGVDVLLDQMRPGGQET